MKKKYFSFFWKKMCFLEIFFRKSFFQNFEKFSAHKKFVKYFLNFFEKIFSKKTLFFKKKKNICFQKHKVLVYRGKNIFFSKKKLFLSKIKCPLNCPFSKMRGFCFSLQMQSLYELPPTHTRYWLIKFKKSSFKFLFLFF